MRLNSFHFFLSYLLALWTCLGVVVASPCKSCAYDVLSTPKHSSSSSDAAVSKWIQLLPFESFWTIINDAGGKVKAMADSVFKDMKEEYHDVSHIIEDFHQNVLQLVENARELKNQLEENRVDLQVVHEHMTGQAALIMESIKKESDMPLPEEMSEKARFRNEMIAKALDKLEDAFVFVCTKADRGLSEEEARRIFGPVKQTVQDGLLIAGNIVDKHPKLAEGIIITAVSMLIPESFILRPILSVFGFGPSGPVKGSIAAWMQSRFWGGAVAKGTWFAYLQRAGMVKGASSKVKIVLAGIKAAF